MPNPEIDVFRFITQRSIQRASMEDVSGRLIELEKGLSPSRMAVRARVALQKKTWGDMVTWAQYYIDSSGEFVNSLVDLATPLPALDDWLISKDDLVTPDEVRDQVKKLSNQAIKAFITSQDFQDDRQYVAGSLLALIVIPTRREALRAELLRIMMIIGLLETLEFRAGMLNSKAEVQNYLRNAVVVLPSFFPTPADALARAPAIADLKVVRQQLISYEMGEIAYIENVLEGESFERVHRNDSVVEETVTTENEQVTEEIHDLQTTDRFEMQKETSKVISEDSSLNVGVSVSASYGPSVSATADFGYAQNNSKQESERVASSYARDVTERSSKRIMNRVREQRTLRTQTEVEDTSKHGIDNTKPGGGHMVGIYRWVDKLYQAQIYNYGKRLLLEFIVPEPASFYRFAEKSHQAARVTLEEPVKPVKPNSNPSVPLSPADLDASNYLQFVRDYYVSGVTPPPADQVIVPLEIEEPAKPDQGIDASTPSRKIYQAKSKLTVTAGYKAESVKGNIYVSDFVDNVFVTVGSTNLGVSEFDRGTTTYFSVAASLTGTLAGETGDLPVALLVENTWGFALALEVTCKLLDSEMTKWKVSTYETIMRAYFELKSQYDSQVAAAQTNGVQIEGHNPLINRQIERTELKKVVIEMLSQQHFDLPPLDGNAIKESTPDKYPETDFLVAQNERNTIQWYEQAFEWNQMMYLLYPYYWSKKSQWKDDALLDDLDPLFAAFCQAGAARVVVPVRPGFEKAIALFLATGIIWNAGQVPQVGTPLYVSLIQELQEQQDADPKGVPEGQPWPVRLPTTLVILQKDGTLPTFPPTT